VGGLSIAATRGRNARGAAMGVGVRVAHSVPHPPGHVPGQ
jgi:hypothetical protein